MKKAKRAFSLKKGRYVNHNQTVLHMFRKKDISVITLQVMLKNILLLSSQLHILVLNKNNIYCETIHWYRNVTFLALQSKSMHGC